MSGSNIFYIIVSIVMVVVILIALATNEHTRRRNAEVKYANADPKLRDDIVNKTIRIGMPESQVIDAWGTPSRRTVRRLKTKT